jgi:hypothetical protein
MRRMWRWLWCKVLKWHSYESLETFQFDFELLTLQRCRRCGRRRVAQTLALVGVTRYHDNLRPYYSARKAFEHRVREEQA